MSDNGRIAVFDSGLGGLTVAAAIRHALPGHDIDFLADRARVPYASLSHTLITKFALECVDFLIAQEPIAVIIGCNTVSAVCLDLIRERSPVPVLGVIEPTALAAARVTVAKKIGVLATSATVKRKAYDKRLDELIPGVEVYSNGCPLLVPLVEEGWTEGEIPRKVVEHYSEPILHSSIDTLILGCTHYEYFRDIIQYTFGRRVKLINTPVETAATVEQSLRSRGELITARSGETRIYSTDVNDALDRVVNDLFADDLGQNRLSIHSVQIPPVVSAARKAADVTAR